MTSFVVNGKASTSAPVTIVENIVRDAADVSRLAVSPLFADGAELYAEIARRGGEGVVAKRRDSRYVEGSRSGGWVKTKVRVEQEFAVAGWTPGEGARAGKIGSLVLALTDDDGSYRFVGMVGTGQDNTWWDELQTDLEPDQIGVGRDGECWCAHPQDAKTLRELRDVRWVAPTVVVQVAFQRWTEDGRLWHPSVKGRRDKEPFECVRE